MPKTIEERVALLETNQKELIQQNAELASLANRHAAALLDIAKLLDSIIQHLDLSNEFIKESMKQ